MTISLKPETERLVREEIQRGHFESVDELIVESVRAWQEKHASRQSSSKQRSEAVEWALAFARNRAVDLGGVTIKELIHEGHRL